MLESLMRKLSRLISFHLQFAFSDEIEWRVMEETRVEEEEDGQSQVDEHARVESHESSKNTGDENANSRHEDEE
jgi:hypothetical protein